MLTAVGPRTQPLVDLSTGAIRRPEAPSAQQPAAPSPATMKVNPSLSFDSVASVLVVEYRDRVSGATMTVPTERQLKAYREAAITGDDNAE